MDTPGVMRSGFVLYLADVSESSLETRIIYDGQERVKAPIPAIGLRIAEGMLNTLQRRILGNARKSDLANQNFSNKVS